MQTSSRMPPEKLTPSAAVKVCFLVGFMGAGKSSVGRALERRLGWRFDDLDERIETREARSVPRIFEESGEAGFRKIEHATLRELIAEERMHPRIVAVGGGAFAREENAELLKLGESITVFLDAPVEELFRRCEGQDIERPLRRNLNDFRNLYQARRAHYLAATLTVDTSGKGVEAVAEEVARHLRLEQENSSR